MVDFLLTGRSGPIDSYETKSLKQIADPLAGAGLRWVRLDDLNAAAVRNALQNRGGNKTHAARELGISVRTLQRQLKARRADAEANGG